MADIAQLEQALIKADAAAQAGSSTAVDDAKVLAAEIRRIRSTDAKPPAAPSMLDNAASAVKTMADKDPMVGSAETLLNLGTGMAGSVAGGISGLGTVATNALGLTNTPPAERVEQVQQALTYQPRTASGRVGTKIATFLPEKVAELGDAGGKRVTDIAAAAGAPPWLAAELGTRMNVGTQAIPAMLARGARGSVVETPAALAERQKRQALNAPVDEGIAAARENRLKITPSQAEAGIVPRIVEGLSGSARLEKLNSKKNAPRFNEMAAEDVGLPEGKAITREAIAEARTNAGEAYEVVKKSGRVATDAQYEADLNAITRSHETAAKDFSHRSENPFQRTLDGLRTKGFDAASAVEEVKLLRKDADRAYKAGDSDLGGAYRAAAQALDDQLYRHMQRTGDGKAVADYRAARERIAKTYAADKALNETTGNIDPNVYAKALENRKPLSGKGLEIAQFARQFPKSAQNVAKAGNLETSFADLLLSLGGGAAGAVTHGVMGGGMAIPALLARPAARYGLASQMAQDSLTTPRSYGVPMTGRLAQLLSDSDVPTGAALTAGALQNLQARQNR